MKKRQYIHPETFIERFNTVVMYLTGEGSAPPDPGMGDAPARKDPAAPVF